MTARRKPAPTDLTSERRRKAVNVKRRRGRRKRHRWYWDVEAANRKRRWDGANLIIAEREDGENVQFSGDDCLEDFADFIQRNPEIYYAHFGGGYDVPLLLNYWRPERIVLTGSTILTAEGRKGLSMRDTFPKWLAGLGKIGDAIGVPKLDVDRALMERLDWETLVDYCRRDVRILKEAMIIDRAWLESYGVNPDEVSTAGTAATHLMEKIEPFSFDILNAHKIPTELLVEMLDATGNPGGMTASYWRGRRSGVHAYDIKSSYPSRYATRDVPIGLRRATENELARPESFQGIAHASFYWPHRRRVPIAYDDISGAGFGEISAWLVDDEIQCLLNEGISVTLSEGWCGDEYAPIGQDFARELFAAKESKGPHSFAPKTYVNSWHGKTGMHPIRDNYEARYPSKYWIPGGDPTLIPPEPNKGWLWHYMTLGCDKNGLAPWHSQPMISAIVLGRARAALWKINNAFQRAGWDVYYNDTDSILTNCPPHLSPVPLGKDLGMLAYEGGPYDAIFLGAKAYILIDSNGQVAKCALKGIPHRSYADAVYDGDLIREARGIERLTGDGPPSIYTRKGIGRDLRIQLFEQALGGSVKAYKEGISSFKRGLRGSKKHEIPVNTWMRDSLTREIRPTITNLGFDDAGWYLLAADEIVSLDN